MYLPFHDARQFVWNLGIDDVPEWKMWVSGISYGVRERPVNVPRHPDKIYTEWRGWEDWVGTRAQKKVRRLHMLLMPRVNVNEHA